MKHTFLSLHLINVQNFIKIAHLLFIGDIQNTVSFVYYLQNKFDPTLYTCDIVTVGTLSTNPST